MLSQLGLNSAIFRLSSSLQDQAVISGSPSRLHPNSFMDDQEQAFERLLAIGEAVDIEAEPIG